MNRRVLAASMLVLPVCVALASAAPGGIRAYDFGPLDSPAWSGFKAVDTKPYSKAAGLGFRYKFKLTTFKQPGPHPGFVGDLQDPLVVDGILAASYADPEFCVDLPNGRYAVWVLTSLYRRSFANRVWGAHRITAEGKVVWALTIDKKNFFDIYYRDAVRQYDNALRREGVWKRYLKPWLDDWKSFEVNVADGQLNLTASLLRDRLHAAVIAPVALKPEAEALIAKVSRDREKWFTDRWREAVPEQTDDVVRPTPADTQRGYQVFARHWMDEVFPTTLPRPDDLPPALKVMATPGERSPTAFCVRALKDLKKCSVTVSDLAAANGARIPASAWEQWVVRYEVRPYPGGTYKAIPVTLEKGPPRDLDARITRKHFLKLRIPEDAAAGVYQGQVTFRADGAPPTDIPLKVRVLPFRLVYPSKTNFAVEMGSPARYLYPVLNDPAMLKLYWDRMRMHLQNVRDHNMTTLHTSLTPAVSVKGDKVVMDWDGRTRPYHNVNKYMRMYKEVGFTGPEFMYQGMMGIMCWGLRMHPAHVPLEKIQSPLGQKLLVEATRQVRDHVKKMGWPEFILYTTGEPTNFVKGVQKAIATFKALKQVPGVRTAMSSISERDHGAFPWVDVILFGSPGENNMGDKMKAQGKVLWGYNSGITRLSYGFYVWRIEARGRTQEHYMGTIQDRPFNDFLGTASCWTYTHSGYGPEGVRPCPRLEDEAEGINDYRYVITLEKAIVEAKAKGGAAAQAAAKSQELLDRIRRHVPNDMRIFGREGGHWEPGTYDRLRSRVAGEILRLRQAMGGQ